MMSQWVPLTNHVTNISYHMSGRNIFVKNDKPTGNLDRFVKLKKNYKEFHRYNQNLSQALYFILWYEWDVLFSNWK